MKTKTCKECHTEKEISRFTKVSKNGYRSICMKCRNGKYKHILLEKNKDYFKEYNLTYDVRKRDDYREYNRLLAKLSRSNCLDEFGYSKMELMEHFQSLFNYNMNWCNYGDVWEICHRVSALELIRQGEPPHVINALSNIYPGYVSDNREETRTRVKYKIKEKNV